MEPSTGAGGYMTAPPPIQTHASIPNQQVYIAKIENTMAAIEEQQLTNDPRYASLGVLRSQLTGSERPTIVEPQTSPSQDQSKLSETQMEQLKSQIEAYKLIARNAPVPKHLLYKATQKKEGLLPLSYEYPMEIESGEKLPYDLMKVFALHQQQAKRVTTLSPPPGIDPQVILRERENRIQNRIGLRIAELEKNFPANVPEHLRVKAEIELRALRLLNLQTHVRNEVLGYLKRDTTIETALNPYAYRRTKRQSLREARVTEKLERQQKMEQERMRRQRHMELLQAILQHGRDFKEFHRNIQVKQSKVKKAVLSYHANSERERKRKEQQKERERLQKLMQEDEEGYRLLLDEKKDKRLVFLLQQTDEYVASLTGLVKQHQAKEKMKKQQEKKDEKQALKQAFNDQEGDDSSEIHVIVRNTTTGEIIKGEEAPKADEIDAWLEAHPGFEVISRDAASDSEDDNDDDYLQRRLPEPKEDEYEGMDEEQKNKMIIEKARNEEDEYDTKNKNQLESYYATAHRIKEKIVKQHSTLGGGDPNLNLKPYQLKGLEWMVSLYNNNLNGILADEMGLGKTIQTVGLITYLMEVKKVNGPYLIVVPLSTISNWVLEFDKWAPHIVKIVYKGTKDMRKRLDMQVKRGAFNVLLTTYDYVMREKSVLGKIRWKYMIIDEGHRMKNHNCKLTITLNAFFHAQHRILLTGTPLQNKLPELWALLNFLLPSIFSSCGTFDQWFNAPFATTGEKVELNQEETMLIIRRLHKVLRPFLLRRLKKEVESELPEKTEYVIKCEQSALQKILYKHMEKGLLLDSKRKEAATSLNNTMAHLRKLCNHPFLFVNVEQECKAFWKTDVIGGKDLYRVAGKFELLDRILPKLKANGHRILIFSQSTELMHILEDYLFYRQWKYLRLDGSTNADKRAELMHTFNEPDSDIFIFMLSTRAGGLGLNLQAADTVIIFDSDWNPHQDMQAQDRAHRIGQQREVRVLRLITVNSIEEKILAAARFKLNIDEKVIQAGKFDQRTTDAERRRILEEIITKEEDNDEDEIPDDDAVNQMIARSEEEFEMFQNMDIERRRQEAAEYRRKPRLIEVDEIPPSLLEASRKFEAKEEEVPDKDLAEKISGDVRRARKKVNYSQDLIDDEEWIRQNLGESGDEDEDERKKNKKGKDKTPGKRGRKKRVIVDEDEEEENDDDGPSEKKKKRSSGEGYQQLEDHLNNMWKQLSEFKKSDGNILCEMFMQLPSKKELPLYYKTISKPIDLSKIKKFIRDGKYLSVEDLTEDIKLMVRNAQDYNEEGSEIYDDSVLINEVWNRLVQMMPFKASSTTPADTPGTSTSTNKARERTPAEGKERTPAKGSKESSKEPSKERSIEIDK